MIVVADTSPLNYLILIGEIELLFKLYQSVVIPVEVLDELQNPGAPAPVLAWSRQPPGWLQIQTPQTTLAEADLATLGRGETAAITLALEQTQDTLLLIDEGKGRRAARRRRIKIIGTLGILDTAAALGLVDVPTAVQRLQRTTFRVAPDLLGRLLDQDIERKRHS